MTKYYEELTLDERRQQAALDKRAYSKTTLKEHFRMKPGPESSPAFYVKNGGYGPKNIECFFVSDCVAMRERRELTDAQRHGLKIGRMKGLLTSNRLRVAGWLDEYDKDSIVFLDTETTGLNNLDQIIEIAVVNGHGVTLYEQRFKPSVDISSEASGIHGITIEQLVDEPYWPDQIDEIQTILGGKTVFIFNADFDTGMLCNTSQAYGLNLEWISRLDTCCMMDMSAKAFGATNRYGTISLYYAACEAGVEFRGKAHSALADALATYDIFESMLNKRQKVLSEIRELEDELHVTDRAGT